MSLTPLRWASVLAVGIRAQANADDSQMARAMALAQRRDYTSGTNLNPSLSLLYFSDEHINESEASRQLHILENNLNRGADGANDPASLVLTRASCLSEDMAEEETVGEDVDLLDLLPKPTKTLKKREKKIIATSDRRHSVRLKKQSII